MGWVAPRQSSTLASLRPGSQASRPGSNTGLVASLAHSPEKDTRTTGQREHLQGPKLQIRSPCSSLFPWAPLVCPGRLRGSLEGKGGVMARGPRKKWGPGGARQQVTWLPVPSPFTLKCPRLTLQPRSVTRTQSPRAGLREPSVPWRQRRPKDWQWEQTWA